MDYLIKSFDILDIILASESTYFIQPSSKGRYNMEGSPRFFSTLMFDLEYSPNKFAFLCLPARLQKEGRVGTELFEMKSAFICHNALRSVICWKLNNTDCSCLLLRY